MDKTLQQLKACAAFSGATIAELRELGSNSRLLTVEPRHPVYLPGDPANSLMLLIQGRIVLGHASEFGKRSWLMFIDPGQLFGEQALLGWPRRDQIAESFEPSQVLAIQSANAQRVMSKSSRFATAMVHVVGERLVRTSRRWSTQFYWSTRERIIHVLLDLSEQYGVYSDQGTHLQLDISHDDLAGFVGSTRESVSVELGKLRSAGLISTARRKVVLRDVRHLAKLVNREARRALQKC